MAPKDRSTEKPGRPSKAGPASATESMARMEEELAATKDELARLKKDLDSMSEMGEMESLRLQTAMDGLSKMMSTLSNVLKKMSDTASDITKNIK